MTLAGYDETTQDIALISFDELRNDINLKIQYLSWMNDREVTKYCFRDDFYDTNKKLDYIEQSFIRFTQEHTKGFFIKYLPFNLFVGTITLNDIDTVNRNLKMGIMIGEKQLWRKAIGFKSFSILIRYVFNELKFHCVYGVTDFKNAAMIKLFEKLNFRRTGYIRHRYFYNGEYRDIFEFSLLENEFTFI